VSRAKLHRLTDVLAISLLAVRRGADEWTEIELFGRSKLHWVGTLLKLPHGMPSHETFGRVFSRLERTRRGVDVRVRWPARDVGRRHGLELKNTVSFHGAMERCLGEQQVSFVLPYRW